MDLSYTNIHNFYRAMERIYREHFYGGHLEWCEREVKNSYGQGELFPDGEFMVMEGGSSSSRSQKDT